MPTSILESASRLLNATLKSVAAENVRVLRGSIVLIDVWRACPGNTRLEAGVDGQLTVIGSQEDWIGDPADWQLEGAPTVPERGDIIEWDRGDYALIYEAMPQDGEKCWRPSGTFDDRIRVHTKLIDRRQLPA